MITPDFIEEYKIEESLCDELIKYWKDNVEYKKIGEVGNGNINKRFVCMFK